MRQEKTLKKIYQTRIKKLRVRMKKENLDAFLVTHLMNIRYLCGFTGSSGSLLIKPRGTVFFSDPRYLEQAAQEVIAGEICIPGGMDLTVLSAGYILEEQLRRVGVESEQMSLAQSNRLKSGLGRTVKVVSTQLWVASLRQIKDEFEIGIIKKAAKITDRAFRKSLLEIREGMSELELFHVLRNTQEEFGGGKLSFDSIVGFGGRSSIIHGQPSSNRLKRGDLILMDFGTVYRGYCSDMTRTVAFGEPGREVRIAYRAVLEAQKAACSYIQAGRKTEVVDKVARKIIQKAGYGDFFQHGLGHSLGLEIHEDPRFSQFYKSKIQSGMVMTVEPGVYLPGQFGIRIEDMILVEKDKGRRLTRSPKELILL